MSDTGPRHAPTPDPPRTRAWTARAWDSGLALILLVTLGRIAYLLWLCPYTLVEDEAHYWEWSRHAALSYYSKGPGIAWAIRAATEIFGTAEWSVRLPAALFGALGASCAAGLARDLSAHPRAGLYAAAIYLCMPAFLVLGVLVTIDGPYLACWAAACWAAWRALRNNSLAAWTLLGIAVAVGFLFKYTILLLPPGLLLAAVLRRRDDTLPARRAAPGVLLALCLAALGLLPVLLWNAQHDFVTFRHLLGHLGLRGGDLPPSPDSERWSPLWPLELIGMQIGLAGPALVLGAFAAQHAWRGRRADPAHWAAARFLLCCSAPIAVFYLLVSAIAEPEGNWPIAAWVTFAPLGALGVARAEPEHRRRLAAWRAAGRAGPKPRMGRIVAWRITVATGVVVALGAARADLAARLPLLGPLVPTGRLMGADLRARDAAAILDALRNATGLEPFVMAQHYGRASQLAYYLPGRPVVYSASAHTGGRTTQYDSWEHTDLASETVRSTLAGRPALLVGGEHAHWQPAFDRIEDAGQLEGEHKKTRRIYLGFGFRGFDAAPATGGESAP